MLDRRPDCRLEDNGLGNAERSALTAEVPPQEDRRVRVDRGDRRVQGL
jgi:hypothetical protein